MGLTVQASSTQWVTGSFPLKIRNKSYYIGPKALSKIKAFTPPSSGAVNLGNPLLGVFKEPMSQRAVIAPMAHRAGVLVQLTEGDKRAASGSGPFL
ncbi:hypothetical protein J0895_10310 [Phormidium pseudopriestleyi FRX01]|uniref:Uncharacterized protein n=1 Tax=Phormidium pseudopriestleyi FRX01 TaxID=1759528 RepID=A0ABS3FR82_9CYAN|nr:hypothetical protein [Phormidium pseudopriestleyi]MBO0349494.1 hypothetical protein [Phormidium pseudopriestleyi FRX01]